SSHHEHGPVGEERRRVVVSRRDHVGCDTESRSLFTARAAGKNRHPGESVSHYRTDRRIDANADRSPCETTTRAVYTPGMSGVRCTIGDDVPSRLAALVGGADTKVQENSSSGNPAPGLV